VVKVHKYALRLITNNFDSAVTYGELLQRMKCQPLNQIVARRRLLNLKMYLDGAKYIAPGVFVPIPPTTDRRSQRLLEKLKVHDKQLAKLQVSSVRIGNLASGQTIKIWNSLPQELVDGSLRGFSMGLDGGVLLQLEKAGCLVSAKDF
jgi:hypothetical protein